MRAIPPPPIVPPPRRRSSAAPRPISVVVKASLIGLMVLVCMGVGWLSVQGPRRRPARTKEEVAKASPADQKPAKETAMAPAPRPEPAVKEKPKEPMPEPVAKRTEPHPPTPKPAAPMLTYEQHVLPILQRSCLSCHNPRRRRESWT